MYTKLQTVTLIAPSDSSPLVFMAFMSLGSLLLNWLWACPYELLGSWDLWHSRGWISMRTLGLTFSESRCQVKREVPVSHLSLPSETFQLQATHLPNAASWSSPGKTSKRTTQPSHKIMRSNKCVFLFCFLFFFSSLFFFVGSFCVYFLVLFF